MSLPPQVIVPENGNGSRATFQRFQIWQCTECDQERHWGFGRVSQFPDAISDPVLNCSKCEEPTRHLYSRLVFSRKHDDIDFGDNYFTWRRPEEKQ